MRDFVLFTGLLVLLPMLLRNAFIGVLAWVWVSLMNPQREVYSLLANFQLNLCIAVLTILVWLLSRERKSLPSDGFVIFLVVFAVWSGVCTYTALDRSFSLPLWSRTMKTMVLVLAVATLARSPARIQAVLWVLVTSIGYYAIKGAGFVVFTGGEHQVFGPADTMITDNNELGLAFVVVLPLIGYLRAVSRNALARTAALATMLLAVLATLGTYSRGALLALAAMASFHALRSRTGAVLLAVGAVLAAGVPAVAPASWLQRMSTIRSYNEDASFQGRVAAWRTSVNIAMARPLVGGGFAAVERDKVVKLFQSPGSLQYGRAAHSVYFEVLGDTGFVGLALYLGVLGSAALNTVLVLWFARSRPELDWARKLARALQTALVAMLVGGSALSMAYYDGFLVILALSSCLLWVVRESREAAAPINRSRPWAFAVRPAGAGAASAAAPNRALGVSFERVEAERSS
ncbi:MAG TPA: putative O-glycosylation ligase, exosortase A system-associated [Caulobacteraceae bacterium]|nr:putative O-glycosylation ligase, exosortase A system-associated [Caulobacteraceae bacterium]